MDELTSQFITKTCLCNLVQIFTAVKMAIFHSKNLDNFLIFAQNIDCGYTLEPPQCGSNVYNVPTLYVIEQK